MALAIPKSMTLGIALPSSLRDQNVRGLQVPVDDAFLMGVLDGLADLAEQLQPLIRRESVAVTVIGDRDPLTNSITK